MLDDTDMTKHPLRNICLIIGVVSVFLYLKMRPPEFPLTTTALGFQMTLVNDEKHNDFYSWSGRVLIAGNDYSRENLEKIFGWYSARHRSGSGTIILNIYTDEENLNKNEFTGLPADPNEPNANPYNAHYIRDERDGGGEFFVYDLDPSKKGKSETVLLKRWKR